MNLDAFSPQERSTFVPFEKTLLLPSAHEQSRVRELQQRMSNIRTMRRLLNDEDRQRADSLLMSLSHSLTGQTATVQDLRLRMANIQAMRPLLDKDSLRQSDRLLADLAQQLVRLGKNKGTGQANPGDAESKRDITH